jgi:histidine triad (HIT) family protein
MNDSCIFCRMTSELTRPFFVTENDRMIAMPALHPITEGHLVVVPREHVAHVSELSTEVGGELLAAGGMLGELLMDDVGATGFTLALHEGSPGQPVSHLHLHVIPRRDGDVLDVPKADEAERDELSTLARRLRERLQARAMQIFDAMRHLDNPPAP